MRDIAGRYAAKVDGENVSLDVTVRLADGPPALFLRTSLDNVESRLYAETPLRLFTLNGGLLTFVRGADGRVTSVEAIGTTFTRVP